MRIGLCFPGCFRRGGVERVVLATANDLSARGHVVHLFAERWEVDQLSPRVIVHQVKASRGPAALALATFGRRCETAIEAQAEPLDLRLGFGVACPRCDVAWVQSVHARWIEVSADGAGGHLAQRWRRRLNPFHAVATAMEKRRFGASGHGHLLALTRDVGLDLERFYGVKEDRWSELPNGFEPDSFNPATARSSRQEARRAFGLDAEDRVLVFVANESIRKGLYDLLKATKTLKREIPSLKVLAAGRLPVNEVGAMAESLAVADRLVMSGPLDDVAQAYAAGDAFVLPTRYEAWGLVIVEALACGLPVVTSRLAGASVAIRKAAGCTLLENPADQQELIAGIRRALKCPPSMGDSPPPCVEPYRWDRIMDRLNARLLDEAEFLAASSAESSDKDAPAEVPR